MLDQPAAEDRSGGRRHRADTRPGADCPSAIGSGERCADDGEASRHEQRGTSALNGSRRDQGACGSRERAPNRRDCENPHANQEDTFSSELVAERATDEHQAAKKQGVRFDHPLDVGNRRVEGVLQRWQRNVHHGRVDERQARTDDRRRERPPASGGPGGPAMKSGHIVRRDSKRSRSTSVAARSEKGDAGAATPADFLDAAVLDENGD
jgi:hypothetical protein